MAVILSLETSTDVCSVALYDGKTLMADAVVRENQAHASRLAPLISQVIDQSRLLSKDLDAVAVTEGPGSYTGLRIGISTAKGLCYALDIPLIAIGTLELLAYQASFFNAGGALLCPMLDARRMEVYSMVTGPDLEIIEPVSALILSEKSFSELLSQRPVLFFGSGAKKWKELIRHPNALFIDDVVPLAASLGQLAAEKFARKAFEDLVHFKPLYLKEFAVKTAAGMK